MASSRTQPANGSALSDRAFRVFYHLSLQTPGEWIEVPRLAKALNVKPHALRPALTELCNAGFAERDRRYLRARGRRPTSRTYFRLTDTTSEASA
ncbi:hypothetical protein [Streptomyces sp. NPDC046976]|uniref:hypothetical protein n=1 Tax=Streptomyces sp. NPDC046976 TaxID=3155258 RepID=UPI0033D21DE1